MCPDPSQIISSRVDPICSPADNHQDISGHLAVYLTHRLKNFFDRGEGLCLAAQTAVVCVLQNVKRSLQFGSGNCRVEHADGNQNIYYRKEVIKPFHPAGRCNFRRRFTSKNSSSDIPSCTRPETEASSNAPLPEAGSVCRPSARSASVVWKSYPLAEPFRLSAKQVRIFSRHPSFATHRNIAPLTVR